MEAASASAALIKAVASYGVLGLGWVAWALAMFYIQVERRRYQGLVMHIIQYFIKVNSGERITPKDILADDMSKDKNPHASTFFKLFGMKSED